MDAVEADAPLLPPDLGFAAMLFADFVNCRGAVVTMSGSVIHQPIDMTAVVAAASALGAAGEFLAATLADVAAFDSEYRRQSFAAAARKVKD